MQRKLVVGYPAGTDTGIKACFNRLVSLARRRGVNTNIAAEYQVEKKNKILLKISSRCWRKIADVDFV